MSPGLCHREIYQKDAQSEWANVFSSRRASGSDCEIRATSWKQKLRRWDYDEILCKLTHLSSAFSFPLNFFKDMPLEGFFEVPPALCLGSDALRAANLMA